MERLLEFAHCLRFKLNELFAEKTHVKILSQLMYFAVESGNSLIFRYGDIFKTHILGCPCVMVASPEAAKVVLVTHAHKFKPTYPLSKERMIGRDAIFFHQGAYHSRLKKLVQASLVPSALKGSIPEIERIVLKFLPAWKNSTINTLQEMKMV